METSVRDVTSCRSRAIRRRSLRAFSSARTRALCAAASRTIAEFTPMAMPAMTLREDRRTHGPLPRRHVRGPPMTRASSMHATVRNATRVLPLREGRVAT